MTIKQQISLRVKFSESVAQYKLTWGKCDGKTCRKIYRNIARGM